jgi:hypothetical protein
MKAKLSIDTNETNGLMLTIPTTGNAAALLLEWASDYTKSPIEKVYTENNELHIKLGSTHSFYSEAMNYINSNI